MKTSRIALIGLILTAIIATPAFAWVQEPTAETGYYYMYDDQSDPPFSEPQLPPMPSYDPIWNNGGNKLAPYSDEPFRYLMPDSFWYFGVWYEPGDNLWFSSDGWVSFDPAAAAGFPDPPIVDPPFPVTADPNELIAPLWQDNDPTRTPEPSDENRQWYYYDVANSIVVFQWYDIQGNGTGNVYDYEVILQLGGQELLEVDDCGVLYSGHLIHFLYNTTSHGWDADNGATGFEDQTGTMGITYPAENLADGRVIRMGYKGPSTAVKEDGNLSPIETLSVQSKTEGYDIHFSVPSLTHVMLEVFDVSGRHLRTLADKTYTAGTHTLYWNGCDAKGRKIAQGVYLVRMETDEWKATRKVVLY